MWRAHVGIQRALLYLRMGVDFFFLSLFLSRSCQLCSVVGAGGVYVHLCDGC